MVVIRGFSGKVIKDSRNDETIEVTIKTNLGSFSASSPTGKSTGKFEARPYLKSISGDIEVINNFSFVEEINDFFDLLKIEKEMGKKIGANTMFAIESAVLKSLAKENGKEVWEILNFKAKTFPRLVGNCVGGGKHSNINKKPDFQEFLLITKLKSPKKSWDVIKEAKNYTETMIMKMDRSFRGGKNDENAWQTSLTDKEVLDILKEVSIKFDLDLGLDIAGSGFYSRRNYLYKNPPIKRNPEEQLEYIKNVIKNFSLYYIEDPFDEKDFGRFSKLVEFFPDRLIVGDDLTVTNPLRFKEALDKNSVTSIIVKPNQIGSLIKVYEVCKMAKENNIKIIFSHRSGETGEDILSDLAFGLGADFIKCGIDGFGREEKIKRLIKIEEALTKKSFKN